MNLVKTAKDLLRALDADAERNVYPDIIINPGGRPTHVICGRCGATRIAFDADGNPTPCEARWHTHTRDGVRPCEAQP